MKQDLKAQVFASLDNAVENGYSEVLKWTAYEVAMDLITFESELNKPFDTLIPFINMWQVSKMSHHDCYVELQDKWITEEEYNSVEFEAKFSRYTLEDIRAELIKYRNAK